VLCSLNSRFILIYCCCYYEFYEYDIFLRLAYILLLLFIISCTGGVEVVAIDNERTPLTSTTPAVVDVWAGSATGSQSSRLPSVVSSSWNNNLAASNNELPTPSANTRTFDDALQYGRTTLHGMHHLLLRVMAQQPRKRHRAQHHAGHEETGWTKVTVAR